MSTPNEKYIALKKAKQLLEELCEPELTPRISLFVRDRAKMALRHFPTDVDIDSIAEKVPNIISKD